MKKIHKLIVIVFGSLFFFPFLAHSQCTNLNFSMGNFTNWQAYQGSNSGSRYSVAPSAPSPGRLDIMDKEVLNSNNELYDEVCGLITKVPDGFAYSARIGNSGTGSQVDGLEYEMVIDSNNSLLILHFAFVLQPPGTSHSFEEKPKFMMKIMDSAGKVIPDLPCSDVAFTAENLQGFPLACDGAVQAMDWQIVSFSLEPLMGRRIKIYFETWDCTQGAHYGYAYIVGECRPMRIDLTFCANSTVARLSAPTGFQSYEWTRSSNANWRKYERQIVEEEPFDGEVFTCKVGSALGCDSELKIVIARTTIDPNFMFGEKDIYGNVNFPAHDYESWYDTCTRTATFVDFVTVTNNKKDRITWEIHGLPIINHDSLFTYTFPDPPTNTPETYLVRLTVVAENSCADTSIGGFITIYPSAQVKIVGPTQLCEGNEDYLVATTIRSKFEKHWWSGVREDGTPIISHTGDSLHINGPGTYYLSSLDTNGCYAYDTLFVTPLRPIMNYTKRDVDCWGNNTGRLQHGAITGGQPPYSHVSWVYHDGTPEGDTIRNNVNIGHTGTTMDNLAAGIYTFWAIDIEGCDVRDTVVISQPDSLRIFPTPKQTTCLKDNGAILLGATGGVMPYSFSAIGAGVNKAGDSIPGLPVGIYTVQVVDNNTCTTSVVAEVKSTPFPRLEVDTIVQEKCKQGNGIISIISHDAPTPTTYTWTPGTNSQGYPIASNAIGYLKAGTYRLEFTDANKCIIDTTFVVGLFPSPIVSYTVRSETCGRKDGEITLNVKSESPDSIAYEWTGLSTTTNMATNLEAGTYSVKVTDSFCEATLSIDVLHVDGPTANFIANSYSVPTNTFFTLTGEDIRNTIATYLWNMGDGTDLTGKSVRHSYGEAGEYLVFLEVIDTNGCWDSTSRMMHAYEELRAYIPNMFTPNGDNLNDTWKPVLLEYSQDGYHLSIYDRWGQRVFYTTNPETAWDGTINGKPSQNNTLYYYRLLIRDFAGQEFEFVGHVTVMR